MATYTTLKYGSIGDEVKKLQTQLNANGNYNLAVDGNFGSKTLAAVKDYQQKNNLAVDGIVGNNTWGALTKSSTPTTPTTTPTTPEVPSFQYKDFEYTKPQDSDLVKQAEAMLQEHMANKPGGYQSPWSAQLSETLDKILNREKFSYDLNGDALYQQYKDQYITQGKQAMMDTIGQASAMTGGYGNSYAATVGNQAYQGYLQQLNDKVPELYQLALAQYNQEGQNLKDQYSILAEQDSIDYGKHRDQVSDFYTNLEYLTGRADTAYNKELTERELAFDLWKDKQDYDYTLHRDAIDDANTAKKQAYDTAMAMLSMGVTPSAQMLQEAGISSADANAIVKKVQANEAKATTGNIGAAVGNIPSGNKPTGNKPVVDDKPIYEETKAVNNFVARIRTKSEFARGSNPDKQKYKTYEAYVKGMLEKYEKDLTDNDVATIATMFGLK